MDLGRVRAEKQSFIDGVVSEDPTYDGSNVLFSTSFDVRYNRQEYEVSVRDVGDEATRSLVAEQMYECVASIMGMFDLRDAISNIINARIFDDDGNWVFETPSDEIRAKVNEVLEEFFSEMYPNRVAWWVSQ